MLKTVAIAGMAILLLSSSASAETNRQKVVKEACYVLDQGQDYACGSAAATRGNWGYVFIIEILNKQKQPAKELFFS